MTRNRKTRVLLAALAVGVGAECNNGTLGNVIG